MSEEIIEHVYSNVKGHFDIRYKDCKEACNSITEHVPTIPGDRRYYDVVKGNRTLRLFDVDVVTIRHE